MHCVHLKIKGHLRREIIAEKTGGVGCSCENWGPASSKAPFWGIEMTIFRGENVTSIWVISSGLLEEAGGGVFLVIVVWQMSAGVEKNTPFWDPQSCHWLSWNDEFEPEKPDPRRFIYFIHHLRILIYFVVLFSTHFKKNFAY